MAALLAAAMAVAGYVTTGWAGLSAVVTLAAAIALAVPRALLPKLPPDRVRTARTKPAVRSLSGYGRFPLLVQTAITSLASYNGEQRPLLEHLPATRPEKSPRGHADQPGIPRHMLARLIDRLGIL